MNGSNGKDKIDQSDQSNRIAESLEEILINLLAEKPDIKTKEIKESLGWPSSQVKYYMKKLMIIKLYGMELTEMDIGRNYEYEAIIQMGIKHEEVMIHDMEYRVS